MDVFKKDNMYADKPIPMVNLPHVRFIGGPTKELIIYSIQVSWEPEILVDIITTVGVPVEEALDDIGMNSINMVIHMEFDGESSWVSSQG